MAAAGNAPGLTDSDILIDAARGFQAAVDFLAEQRARAEVRICVVSAMELIAGCGNKAQLTQVQQFLQRTTVLPVSDIASQMAYRFMESFFLSHSLLIPDALIAATALDHGLILYTKNTRHFDMIPGIKVIRPY